MKKKLRKIVVEDSTYWYVLSDSILMETYPDFMQIRIFLDGHKATPLTLNFYHDYDAIQGFALNSGLALFNAISQTTEMVNINQPKYIREFILLGKKHGWTGDKKFDTQNGMAYLAELGFDVSKIVKTLK